MIKSPAFRLYPLDFIGDPVVDAMTPEQLGGYFRLICHAWNMKPKGVLPNDVALLSAWSRLGPRWEEISGGILRAFEASADGKTLKQKRMVREAKKQEDYRLTRVRAGKKGAESRWLSHDFANGKTSLSVSVSDSVSGDLQNTDPPYPPNGGTPRAPKPKKKPQPDPNALEVLAKLNAARSRVIQGARDLGPQEANLKHIAARLQDGHTLDECLHVIAVREAEVKRGGDPQWFNAVTPFRPDNFSRTLASQPGFAARSRTANGEQIRPQRSLLDAIAELDGPRKQGG